MNRLLQMLETNPKESKTKLQLPPDGKAARRRARRISRKLEAAYHAAERRNAAEK